MPRHPLVPPACVCPSAHHPSIPSLLGCQLLTVLPQNPNQLSTLPKSTLLWGLFEVSPPGDLWFGDKHKLCGAKAQPLLVNPSVPSPPWILQGHYKKNTIPDFKAYLDRLDFYFDESKQKNMLPNKWNNGTVDKCMDELQDITVNWGHSQLFVRHPTPLFNSAFFLPFGNSLTHTSYWKLNSVSLYRT